MILFYYDTKQEVNLHPTGHLVYTKEVEAYGSRYIESAILYVYKKNERIYVEASDKDKVVTPERKKAIGLAIESKLESHLLSDKINLLKDISGGKKLYEIIRKRNI